MSRPVPFPRVRSTIGFMAAGACFYYAIAEGRHLWLLVGGLFAVAGASMAGWFRFRRTS